MSAYVVIQVNITNPQKYDEYKKISPAALPEFGGRFLARGGAATDFEGERPYSRMVVIEFPSVEHAKRWYASPAYQAAKALRDGAGDVVFTVIEGV